MKLITSLLAVALSAGSVAAHSWLECVDTDVPNYAAAKANPNIDPNYNCKGFPRNKKWNGDWISESSYYLWDLNGASNNGLACNPIQSTPTYPSNVPMVTAQPGDSLRLRFWGNGHSSWSIGSPNHRDPGLVRVYWAGKKETELTSKSDLSEQNWFPGAQANFSGDAITLITGTTMNEKANYMTLTLPNNIENGRHMMAWVWAWGLGLEQNGPNFNPATDYNREWENSYSTCFDIMVTGSKFGGPTFDNTVPVAVPTTNQCSTGTCYKGGMTQYPCTGSNCPACWYKSGDQINCFDYGSNGQCPFGGAFDCKLNKQTRRALKHERTPFI